MGHAPVVVPGSVVSDPFAALRALPRGRAGGSASVHQPSLAAQKHVDASVAPARPLARELPGSSHVTPPELGARFGTGSLNAGSLSNGPLDAPRPSRRLAPSGRPGAAPRPSQLVSQQVLQHLKVQRLVGHDALEPSVLVLKCLQPPRVTDLKAPVLLLPPIERVVADPVASAYLFVAPPASASCRIPMICSSVNLLFLMTPHLL